MRFTYCYVDESIYSDHGFVVTAMVFAGEDFESKVTEVLISSGLTPLRDEFKSSARMDSDPKMNRARSGLLHLLSDDAHIAVVIGPFRLAHLGRQVLQALQSVVIRNAIERNGLEIFFDREVFASQSEAVRLHQLFKALQGTVIHAHQDSKRQLGIQAADIVAHCFGQIVKEEIVGAPKMIDIGSENSGYLPGTMAPLGWALLMTLRHSLFTRPIAYEGSDYPSECDPVVIDPIYDDPSAYGQHPVLLGWGVQVAPESDTTLRLCVEQALGKLWLGCIH